MALPPDPAARKGRGASSNPDNRFFRQRSEAVDDGWGSAPDPLPALATTVTPVQARSIISRNDSPDVPFTLSINPYQGCEHVICTSKIEKNTQFSRQIVHFTPKLSGHQ